MEEQKPPEPPRIGPKSLAQDYPPMPHEPEDHDEHPDERWLVSYADMMTLLFGLFVLLFSMSTLDPQVAAQIQNSTQQSFKSDAAASSAPAEPTVPASEASALQQKIVAMEAQMKQLQEQLDQRTAELAEKTVATPTVDAGELERLRAENTSKEIRIQELEQDMKKLKRTEVAAAPATKNKEPELEAQVARLKEQLKETNAEAKVLMAELTDLKLKGAKSGDPAKAIKEAQAKLEKAKADNEKIIELARKVSGENKLLNVELAELKKENASLDKKAAGLAAMDVMKVENQRLKAELDAKNKVATEMERKIASANPAEAMKAENQKLKSDLDKSMADLAKEKLQMDAMKKEAEAMNGGKGQDFMAFFINWPTKDHDVDLVIQDPAGKVFDFKRREYKGQPGLFALDTRRGPGVELWQSKNIVPGRYKATYSLYNDYGNSEPAPVSAVILTPKGSFELPIANLNTSGNRKVTAEFEVDKLGGVKIIKGK